MTFAGTTTMATAGLRTNVLGTTPFAMYKAYQNLQIVHLSCTVDLTASRCCPDYLMTKGRSMILALLI